VIGIVKFAAIVLMALALVPAGAHLFELPHKMGLGRDAYLTVQGIYAGWAYFGIVLIAALVADLVLMVTVRHERAALLLAAGGLVSIAIGLAIFFAWTFPANQATASWTRMPDDWETLRRNWEYSHAANAVVTFAGFCSTVGAALVARS
jgi:uncharacterized membrane protein HdeD (DUF308 family)